MDEDNHQQTDQNGEITLEKLQLDLDSAMYRWKRTLADFENYKRRKETENQELIAFAKEVTVVKLLPALDSLEQALRHMPEYHPPSPFLERAGTPPILVGGDLTQSPPAKRESSQSEEGGINGDFAKKYQQWQAGVNGLVNQLDKALEELGVKKIEAVGKKFDPYFHEAVREVESPDAAEGMVVEELQTGFELNGKVIRPSQVVISKKQELGSKN